MGYWLHPSCSEVAFRNFGTTTALQVTVETATHDPESTSRDAFLSSLPGLHQAPLMGFPKNAPPSGWALVVHSCFEHLGLAPSGSRLRRVLAGGHVLFRLRGFPPPCRVSPSRVSRVCCTPQPIMGFAALGVDSPSTEMLIETHLSATPHPSKHLHACSRSPGSFTVPWFS